MFVRLSLGAGLIAATVVIQALFMTVGLSTFKRIEERRPGAMARMAEDLCNQLHGS